MLSTENGALRVLKSTDWRGVSNLALSPDGSQLAFDMSDGDARSRDLFLLSTSAAREVPLVASRSDETLVGWSTDGKQVLFLGNRAGAPDLWSVEIHDGSAKGEPVLLKRDAGRFWPLGVTETGALYGATFSPPFGGRLKLLSLDPAMTDPSSPRVLDEFVGPGNDLRWSHSGSMLAAASQWIGTRPLTPRYTELLALRLVVRDLSGVARELQTPLEYINNLEWAPDDESLLVAGADLQGRRGVFRVDVSTGTTTVIVRVEPDEQAILVAPFPQTGDNLYYRRIRIAGQTAKLVAHNLRTGEEVEILPYGPRDQITVLGVTDTALLTIESDAAGMAEALVLSDLQRRHRVELLRLSAPDTFVQFGYAPSQRAAWARNRESIFVMKGRSCTPASASCSDQGELWQVRLDGQGAVRIGMRPQELRSGRAVGWAPDTGSLLLATSPGSRADDSGVELWAWPWTAARPDWVLGSSLPMARRGSSSALTLAMWRTTFATQHPPSHSGWWCSKTSCR